MMTRNFPSLEAFATFLVGASVEEVIADASARGGVAGFLTKEIKDRIGDPDRLPPPLAESTQEQRAKDGFSADQTLLRTGELRDSIGWEHIGRRETVVGSTDEKAPFHEFGTSRIPRRSFLASTVVEKNDEAFALYMKIFETSFLPR
jgi:phage gpG-like protein